MAVHTGLSGANLPSAQLTDTFGVFAFELQDLPQAATFTSAFDQYRIDRVRLHLAANQNVNAVNAATSAIAFPPLIAVVDRDDSTALTTVNAALEYDELQMVKEYQSMTIDLKPALAPAFYQVGAFAGYGVSPGTPWLDAASPAIRYYGIKTAMAATASAINVSWSVLAEYFVSFRNVR
jgi:hypothetical protein